MGFYSVNVCSCCRKQLSITADKLGYRECAECTYFHSLGIYSTQDYNNWLKRNKWIIFKYQEG